MVYLGGKIHHILDSNMYDTMFNIQSFMLDKHPDIVCTVKGVRSNYGHKGAIGSNQIVTSKSVTEGISTIFLLIVLLSGLMEMENYLILMV